jgi:hypothetical protein
MKFSWKDAPDLMARLQAAQNHPGNLTRDVMTFAGFCDTREELESHVLSCEAHAKDA